MSFGYGSERDPFVDEWFGIAGHDQKKLMITASVPYLYRWKVLQLKLMLNDLSSLYKQYSIKSAFALEQILLQEAEDLFKKMTETVQAKRKKIEELVK